jgi:hypothetical protein
MKSESCAGVGVGKNAARIVIDVRGNKTRPDYGEEE